MKISVIITCYAEGNKILSSIESIEAQNFKDYELIIVNDKSVDEATNLVCKELQKRGYEVIWRENNGGLSAARNSAISAAKNEIIVPLDGDDILPKNSLYIIQEAFRSNPEVDFIFGNYIKYSDDQSLLVSSNVLCTEDGYLDAKKLANNWILLGTSPFKKSLWTKINGYDQHKLITNSVQDIDFFMRAIDVNLVGKYIPETIYQWSDSVGSMNKNVQNVAFKELMLKNESFLLKYKFKNTAELKNYMITSLFGNKYYTDVIKYVGNEGLRNLTLKSLMKYYLSLVLKRG